MVILSKGPWPGFGALAEGTPEAPYKSLLRRASIWGLESLGGGGGGSWVGGLVSFPFSLFLDFSFSFSLGLLVPALDCLPDFSFSFSFSFPSDFGVSLAD